MGGAQFESEIREQPAVLRRIAAAGTARRLTDLLGDREVVFTGSGSSLFVAQLAALVWRRTGRRASAIAASEAKFYGPVKRGTVVVALSQSGRTGDVLDAMAALSATFSVALTNDAASPLAALANATFDIAAGAERAVPASKSVTAMAALLLSPPKGAAALNDAADVLAEWLDRDAASEMDRAGALFAAAQSIVVVGAGFGVPVADEIALKIKESSYRHAEGFGAGEFRHGSTAILDGMRGAVGLTDAWSFSVVGDVLETARAAGSAVAAFGEPVDGIAAFGPEIAGPFAPLGWIVAGQMLALALARRDGIDSDAPRGLQKFLT